MKTYQIEILQYDIAANSLVKITEVLNPMELGASGNVLEFSKELSAFGQLHFRVSAFDNMLTQYGDIFVPHQYHVRLRRNGQIVWQGAIIENTKRTKQFIDVIAAEYLWYLSKILIKRSSVSPLDGVTTGVYRVFQGGTMQDAVNNIINEVILAFGPNGILGHMVRNNVQNPNFPPNMTDSTAVALTGPWTFGLRLTAIFDFQDVYHILQQFGIWSFSDFQIDSNLNFNFMNFIGRNKQNSVQFHFFQKSGQAQNNIIDYNLPRLGQQMANDLFGVATNAQGTVLHNELNNQDSINTYGLMQAVAAYKDVSDGGVLNARILAELPLVDTPVEKTVSIVLNETTSLPLGVWDVGDIVQINIQNKGVSFNDTRRIVGASVAVHNTGREFTTVETNKPLSWQIALATANGS